MSIIILFISSGLQAQVNLDSLKKEAGSKTGDAKYSILQKLRDEYSKTDAEAAYKYALETFNAAEELKDESKIADSYHEIGALCARLNKNAEAIKNFSKALEYYKSKGDSEKAAYIQNELAGVDVNLGRYEAAMELYSGLLTYYTQKNNLWKYSSILNNMGTLLDEKKDFDSALDKFLTALETIKKVRPDDNGFLAILYCNLGDAYYGKKEYALSLKYRKMSLELYKKMNDSEGIADLMLDVGSSLMKLHDYGRAVENFLEAQKNYSRLNFPAGIRKAKSLFVEFYIEIKDFEKADKECGELENLSSASRDSIMLEKCFEMYAGIKFNEGNYKASSEYYKKYIDLRDKLSSLEGRRKMYELQTMFDTEEKDFENRVLKQENDLQKEKLDARENLLLVVTIGIIVTTLLLIILFRKDRKIKKIDEEIRIKNLKLEELLVSKDKFFSILAHNLKNPFWAILGQNKLLEEQYDELEESDKKELISRIGALANNVYKMFEDLLKWAKARQSKNEIEKESLLLKDLIEASIAPYAIISGNKRVEIVMDIDGTVKINADRFMLETVFGNLVDNAIKFSNPDERIIITGKKIDDKAVITIRDFGTGIPKDKMDKLFKIDEDVSSAGTMNEKGTGLGLLICKEFIEKHNGAIKLESEIGAGTTFRITLPLN